MHVRRRDFLKSTLATSSLVSIGGVTIPSFLAQTAQASHSNRDQDRILVVVQLVGGNDGLNTVVPYKMDGYLRHRKRLRLPKSQLNLIDSEIALHPSMGSMAQLLEDDHLSILQGVGYPNPDRSHFRSMEIWETAKTASGPEALETGWLGRLLDQNPPKPGDASPALHVGDGRLPLAYRSKQVEVPSLERVDQFKLQLPGAEGDQQKTRSAMLDVAQSDQEPDPLLNFLRRSTLTAYDASQRLEQIASDSNESTYPNYDLARRLEQIAKIIKAEFGTRIYYTRQGGYDTHANQLGSHAGLLNELSDSLGRFHEDLTEAGHADRVSVLVFSEFGRRVAENASFGTDHGAAAPVFLIGPVAQAGLVGAHPSFDDLDDGDLKHHLDFRTIYATLLQDWLGVPAAPIVGKMFQPISLLKTS